MGASWMGGQWQNWEGADGLQGIPCLSKVGGGRDRGRVRKIGREGNSSAWRFGDNIIGNIGNGGGFASALKRSFR